MAEPQDMTLDAAEKLEYYELRNYRLEELLQISRLLNSTLDYESLMEAILFTCMGQMSVREAGLFVRRTIDDADLALHRGYKGFELNHKIDYSIPKNHKLLRHFRKESVPMTIDEVRDLLEGDGELDGLFDLNPSLIVPLKSKGFINGLIILGDQINGSGYDESAKEFILGIASFASIAVHNAFLFEMTTTDMMTRLKMKHFFQSSLIDEQEKANQSGNPLSLIMIDIDHFKHLNDTYGHICGDQVLKEVAHTIQASIRHRDIAARYGGEEFVVLLPETDIHTGLSIAERIRENVQNLAINYNNKIIRTTVSLGVAQHNKLRDTTARMFVNRADMALYYSKQHGRNQVSEATM